MKKRIWILPTSEELNLAFRTAYRGTLELLQQQSLGVTTWTTGHRLGLGQSRSAYVATATAASRLANSASVRDAGTNGSRTNAFRDHTNTPASHQTTLRREGAGPPKTGAEEPSSAKSVAGIQPTHNESADGNGNPPAIPSLAKPFATLSQVSATLSSVRVELLASKNAVIGEPAVAVQIYSHTVSVIFDSNIADAVDVASFGAVGDGVTDDSPAIQNAEIYAASHGKILKFGAGNFLLKEKLYLQTNDHLSGCIGATTLQAAPGLGTLMALNGSPTGSNGSTSPISNVSVSGLIFNGDLSNSRAGPLVVAYIANRVTFTDDAFFHCNDIGILLSNTANSVIDSCSIGGVGNKPLLTGNLADAAQGIAFTDSSILKSNNNTVSGCTFSAIGLDAISASDQTGFSVTNNMMIGLNILSGWNHYSAGAAGVYLTNDSAILATGNYISGASGNGFDLDNVSNVIISSNQTLINGSGGIVLAHTTNALISNNRADDNNQLHGHFQNQSGISITGNAAQPSTAISVIGNTADDDQVSATQSWGFQVVDGAVITKLILSGNYFGGNAISYSNRHDLCSISTFKVDTNLKIITDFVLSSNVADASMGFSPASLVSLAGNDVALLADLVHPNFRISHAVSLADLQALSLSSLQSSSSAGELSSKFISASHQLGFLHPSA